MIEIIDPGEKSQSLHKYYRMWCVDRDLCKEWSTIPSVLFPLSYFTNNMIIIQIHDGDKREILLFTSRYISMNLHVTYLVLIW